MAFNPGTIVCTTTAAITHNQRTNNTTDSDDSTTYSPNKIIVDYHPLSSTKKILEELKNVLEQEKNKDESSISLYELLKLVRKKYEECFQLDLCLIDNIESLTQEDALFLDVDYDCENKCLIISSHCEKIYFTKQNGDLIILKSQCCDATDILNKCGKEISVRYDKFIEDISFYSDYINHVKSSNSNFRINSDEYGIYISENLKYMSEFKISAFSYENEYEYDCNSNNIISVCRGKEDEIFKRIFVNINDCPKWTHEILYQIRKEQLEKQEKKEYRELKKQRRLELVRKLNPFKIK